MSIINRIKAPTPRFFKRLRNIGLMLAAAGGAVLAATVPLPEWLLTISGYITVTGTVLSAVSQVTVKQEEGGA